MAVWNATVTLLNVLTVLGYVLKYSVKEKKKGSFGNVIVEKTKKLYEK